MARIVPLVAAAVIAVGTAGEALGKGEFKREVPKWWLPGAWCVHRGEGAWNANTGNGYHGGMQMDWNFMRHYGNWSLRHLGTADRWPIRTQLLVAYRGWRVQGWGAWPVTARRCGLL